MSFFALSDLHIRGSDDPLYESLLKVIRDRARGGDTLVLAGDVFDFFVGDKLIFIAQYSRFFAELGAASQRGVKIHYIEGNHDFLLRRAFAGIPAIEVHSHHVTEELDGKRFYVAHGDTVDQTDYGYLALRMFLRSPIIRAFVKFFPGSLINWIGETGSRRSRQSQENSPKLAHQYPCDRFERIRKVFRSFAAERLTEGFDFVVLGHCHDLDEMRFQIGGRTGQYVNVGYPRVHGSFLSWERDDEYIRREALP